MNRRGFLNALCLTPAVAVVDRKHLWTRLVEWFSPKPEPEYLFTDWVAPEAMRLLETQLEFANGLESAIGNTVRIKFPQEFIITEGCIG